MLECRLEPEHEWWQVVAVRLLRRWAAAASNDENALPAVVELALSLGISTSTAVALASLYQLTEGCLGRPLVTECCCSPELSADERATLMLIAAARVPGAIGTSIDIPHSLPGALAWAATAVRRLLNSGPLDRAPTACPFTRSSQIAIASYSH